VLRPPVRNTCPAAGSLPLAPFEQEDVRLGSERSSTRGRLDDAILLTLFPTGQHECPVTVTFPTAIGGLMSASSTSGKRGEVTPTRTSPSNHDRCANCGLSRTSLQRGERHATPGITRERLIDGQEQSLPEGTFFLVTDNGRRQTIGHNLSI
jgi:hypothetical protein